MQHRAAGKWPEALLDPIYSLDNTHPHTRALEGWNDKNKPQHWWKTADMWGGYKPCHHGALTFIK
jgi:hypothetical protein